LRDAAPLTTYVATTRVTMMDHEGTAGGEKLKYTWSLPADWSARAAGAAGGVGAVGSSRDVVIVLPSVGVDHRWVSRVWPHEGWRRGEIVVCIDPPRARLEGGGEYGRTPADVGAIRDVTLEIVRAFPTRRIVLYGHGQGGFAALAVAAAFPRLYSGVVVHGAGMSSRINLTGAGAQVRGVPIIFVHGTEDQVAPYLWAIDARDTLAGRGNVTFNDQRTAVLGLRRIIGGRHEADASEASGAIDWILGMTTDSPAEAVQIARQMLTRLDVGGGGPGGEAGATTDAAASGRWLPFGLARQILARLEIGDDPKAWPRGFKSVDAPTRAAGKALADAIDAHALKHTASLRAALGSARALSRTEIGPDLPVPAWSGQVLAAREELRGVPTFEAFAAEMNLDDVLASHDAAAREIIAALEHYQEGTGEVDAKALVGIVRRDLSTCWLFEAMPRDLFVLLEDFAADEALGLSARELETAPMYRAILRARDQGRAAYGRIAATFELP
jgi:pimeloyl-ACP methyl ester carboxylesterase